MFPQATAPQAVKPSRWYYLLSILILVAGVSLFVFLLIRGIGGITDKLVQMEAPGTAEMTFQETGTYTVFYERQSVMGGRVYNTGQNLQGLWVNVVSKETGDQAPITQSSTRTTYTIGGRSGVSVLEFNVDRPGVYQISAAYRDNRAGQPVVLAIGHGVAGRIVGTVLGGLGALFGSILLAAIIFAVTFVKRRRASRAHAWPDQPANPQAYFGR